MGKTTGKLRTALISGAVWISIASVISTGASQIKDMHVSAAPAETPAAVTLELQKPAGPAAQGTENIRDIIPAYGAAAALEESPEYKDIAELEHVGAAAALTIDESGAKSAAFKAVSIINAAQDSANEIKEAQLVSENEALARDPEHFSDLVIADVNDYVNVRAVPSTDGEVVGKLYDHSAGEFLEECDEWYKIRSGNVTGYVKAEYCVTGEDAIELAKKVGTRMATVNTTTLKVRTEPDTESEVLGLIPRGEDLLVLEETEDFVKVSIEEGDGYVSTDYVDLRTDFVHAESKAEEEARLAKEEAERKAAREAAEAARKKAAEAKKKATAAAGTSGKSAATYVVPEISGSGAGTDVANFACQFVGNPYVYGGSSLTNGTDCSGFVMSVYQNFGVKLPHSSTADRSVGYAVNGLENAQPGDILCYSGHVAIYIGGGRIVHASTTKTGIVIGDARYRGLLGIRRIF